MSLQIAQNFRLPDDAVTQTFALLARRSAGKTYAASVMAEEMGKNRLPFVWIDPIGVSWGLRSSADGKQPGLPVVILGGDHADVPLTVESGETVARFIVRERVSAVLDLKHFRKNEQIRFMTAFAETLYHLNREPLHVFIDEADSYAPQRPYPEGMRLLGAIEDIVRRGRARGLGVTLITQRAAVIHKDVLTQTEALLVLQTTGPQDRKAVKEWVDTHISDESQAQIREFMESLPSLQRGQAWIWSPSWLKTFERITIRRRETFDSSATPKMGQARQPKVVADVDLESLKISMAAVIEEAKADDPKELRKQITILKRQLAEKMPPANSKVDLEAQIDKAVATALREQSIAYSRHLDKLGGVVKEAINKHISSIDPIAPVTVRRQAAEKETSGTSNSGARVERHNSNSNGFKPILSGSGNAGWRRMLVALAQKNGLSTRQIGLRAGLSSKSGTFGTYMSKLRQEGLIAGSGESVSITSAGLDTLGPYDPLPSGEALLRYWQSELGSGSGAARILQALYDSYPQPLSYEQIGERAQISHASGTFGTYLSKLRALELVKKSNKGLLLSEELL
jgi:uncharacterized protein